MKPPAHAFSNVAIIINPYIDAKISATFGEYAALALKNSRRNNSLEQSSRRYKSLFNNMIDGFALHEIICDAEGTPVDYRFIEVNPAFETMTGRRRLPVQD